MANTGEAARERFLELLDRHRGIVLKVAHSYCRDAEDRLDLVQEIHAQLWRGWPSYDPQRPFTTWMYRVALNVAISWVRATAAHRRHHAPVDDRELAAVADGGDETRERQHLLLQVLERLDPMHRALLLLHLEDRSQHEIADVLGISESNVATRLHRLRRHLRELFAANP